MRSAHAAIDRPSLETSSHSSGCRPETEACEEAARLSGALDPRCYQRAVPPSSVPIPCPVVVYTVKYGLSRVLQPPVEIVVCS